ncbi:hypothetical protein QE152_g13617 [Popillia japonica]|uniref:PHD-type domain-containing protein n=1 Tax=Popillia japonica TaxID=7064 RepID=A0AAW1LCD3_POPJA
MSKCGACSKKVSRYDDSTMCNKGCGEKFHSVCVDVSEEQLTNLKTTGNIRQWACSSCETNPNLQAAFRNKNVVPVKLILTYKLLSAIKIYKTIKYMKRVDNITSDAQKSKDTKNVNSSKTVNTNTNNNTDKNKTVNNNTNKDDTYKNKTEYTAIIKEIEERRSKENNSSDSDGFQPVVNRRKNTKPRTVIMGLGTNTKLKAVMKYSYLYISKLDKDTTVEDIIKYLEGKNFSEIKCDKMNSKRPDIYSSFRLGVLQNRLLELKDPNIWPLGTYVNNFFWKMKPLPETN